MPKLIKYRSRHGFNMNWYDITDYNEAMAVEPGFFYYLEGQEGSFTLIDGKQILGILLCRDLHPQNCEICLYMATELVKNFNKDIYQIMKDFIAELKTNYRRVSATYRLGKPKLDKLMKHLGFKWDGILPAYYLNGDHAVVWSIIRER